MQRILKKSQKMPIFYVILSLAENTSAPGGKIPKQITEMAGKIQNSLRDRF
jgi:hypothetical protein